MNKALSVVNGLLSVVGTGPLGSLIVARHGLRNAFSAFYIVSASSLALCSYLTNLRGRIQPNRNKIVFITGCDSGIGYSFALHCFNLGFTVVSGVLNKSSIGCKQLEDESQGQIHTIKLDVTRQDDIANAVSFVSDLVEKQNYEFHSLINNAGVMIFGEFEWLSDRLLSEQINVNIFGTMRVTRALLDVIRLQKARIITIGSHCGFGALPGLATYASTKSALHAWSDALRVEMQKFGAHVIVFVPGSYVTQSHLMARLHQDESEMLLNLKEEQAHTYDGYFQDFYKHLKSVPVPNEIKAIDDLALYRKLTNALTDVQPSPYYMHETAWYRFNRICFQYMPVWIRDMRALAVVHPPLFKKKPAIKK